MWPWAGVADGFVLERAIRTSQRTDAAPFFAATRAADADAVARSYADAVTRAAKEGAYADTNDAAAFYAAKAALAAAYAAGVAASKYDTSVVAAKTAVDAAKAATDAPKAENIRAIYAISRRVLIRLIAADIQILYHQSAVDPLNRSSVVHFGPLWGVVSSDIAADLGVTKWDHLTASRLLEHTPARVVVGFAARCVWRVQALADLNPTADTTGVVYAIWQAEAVAWDVQDKAPRPWPRASAADLPRGESNRVSPLRRAIADAVDRAALALLQATNSVEAESGCIESSLLVAQEAIEAVRLADEVDREEFGHPSTAQTDSLLAGMWDDLWQLADAGDGPALGFGPREHYRPLWAFNEVTDLPARIADLKKRFAPPPAPLILPRVPKVTEDEQRRIEALARQLLGGDHTVKVWFKLKSPDLGNKTPLSVLKTGNLGLLEFHIRSALRGDFG